MNTKQHAELLHAVEFGTIPEKLAAAEKLAENATAPEVKDLWAREARTLKTLLTIH